MITKNLNTKRILGFSLIELMIVVAIIGILASIAVPAYNQYINRSRVSELITAAVDAKKSVEDFIASNGITTPAQVLAIAAASGYANNTPIVGTSSIGTIRVTLGGVVQVTPSAANPLSSAGVAFPGISLVPTLSGNMLVWQCTPGITTGATVGTTNATAATRAMSPASCRF